MLIIYTPFALLCPASLYKISMSHNRQRCKSKQGYHASGFRECVRSWPSGGASACGKEMTVEIGFFDASSSTINIRQPTAKKHCVAHAEESASMIGMTHQSIIFESLSPSIPEQLSTREKERGSQS